MATSPVLGLAAVVIERAHEQAGESLVGPSRHFPGVQLYGLPLPVDPQGVGEAMRSAANGLDWPPISTVEAVNGLISSSRVARASWTSKCNTAVAATTSGL